MSIIEESIKEHISFCHKELPSKFVHWYWLVGILSVLIMGIGGISWSASKEFNDIKHTATLAESKATLVEEKINKLERMESDIKWIRRTLESR